MKDAYMIVIASLYGGGIGLCSLEMLVGGGNEEALRHMIVRIGSMLVCLDGRKGQ